MDSGVFGRRWVLVPAGVIVAAVALAGCASGSQASDSGPSDGASGAAGGSGQQSGGQQSGGPQGGGGVWGTIAAMQDSVLQVQDGSTQTAVSYDGSTTIVNTVAASLADVTVGSCVVVDAGNSNTADGGTDSSNVVASSVTISQPVDGSCAGGMVGPGQGGGQSPSGGTMPTDMPSDMPSDMPTDMPTGRPSDMPTDMPSGMPANGSPGLRGASGLVTAIDATTITVESTMPAFGGTGDGGAAKSGTGDDASEPVSQNVSVTVSAATEYSKTVAADASAISAGLCVRVEGQADDRGQVTATSLTLSPAGTCERKAAPGGSPGEMTNNSTQN